jgi:CTP:molybdopterin cytidylyltransferase MocA
VLAMVNEAARILSDASCARGRRGPGDDHGHGLSAVPRRSAQCRRLARRERGLRAPRGAGRARGARASSPPRWSRARPQSSAASTTRSGGVTDRGRAAGAAPDGEPRRRRVPAGPLAAQGPSQGAAPAGGAHVPRARAARPSRAAGARRCWSCCAQTDPVDGRVARAGVGARVVLNPDPTRVPVTSDPAGAAASSRPRSGHRGAARRPSAGRAHHRRGAARGRGRRDRARSCPRYQGRRGHPVVLKSARLFAGGARRDLPEGVRTVLRRDPTRVREVPVEDPGVLVDLDTPRRCGGTTGRAAAGARLMARTSRGREARGRAGAAEARARPARGARSPRQRVPVGCARAGRRRGRRLLGQLGGESESRWSARSATPRAT